MITIVKMSRESGSKYVVQFRGLSADTKPTGCGNGSTFYEIDTGDLYCFDEENTTWYSC